MKFKRADISKDITAQMLSFDPVLQPEGEEDILVQDADWGACGKTGADSD